MVGFDFVVPWREADAIERPLLDVFVAWDFVPAFEFFFGVDWNPVEPERTVLVGFGVA